MMGMLFTLHGRNFNLTHMQELGEQASWILSFLARLAAGALPYLPWKVTVGETLLQLRVLFHIFILVSEFSEHPKNLAKQLGIYFGFIVDASNSLSPRGAETVIIINFITG